MTQYLWESCKFCFFLQDKKRKWIMVGARRRSDISSNIKWPQHSCSQFITYWSLYVVSDLLLRFLTDCLKEFDTIVEVRPFILLEVRKRYYVSKYFRNIWTPGTWNRLSVSLGFFMQSNDYSFLFCLSNSRARYESQLSIVDMQLINGYRAR